MHIWTNPLDNWSEQVDVGLRKAGGPEPGGHGFRGFRDAAGGRVGGVDLDEPLVDLPRAALVRR